MRDGAFQPLESLDPEPQIPERCKMFRTQTITPRWDFSFPPERAFTNRLAYMTFRNILHFALSRRVEKPKKMILLFEG